MPFAICLLVLVSCLTAAETTPTRIETTAPLVINLTAGDPHRIVMALSFGANQLKRGHPTTIYLNDRGVQAAVAQGDASLANGRELLVGLIRDGASVLACPMCTAHYGLSAEAYLPGVQMSSPERIEAALFAPGVRTLSW